VSTSEPLIKARGNTLGVNCEADLGSMHADSTKVRQCLLNLISNAAKFTEKGTISIEASRESAEGADFVVFRVSDTGIGITPYQMERIFEPFFQANARPAANMAARVLGWRLANASVRRWVGRSRFGANTEKGPPLPCGCRPT